MRFIAMIAAMVATVAALCESGMTVLLFSDATCSTEATYARFLNDEDILYHYDVCVEAGSHWYKQTCENEY